MRATRNAVKQRQTFKPPLENSLTASDLYAFSALLVAKYAINGQFNHECVLFG